MDGPVDLRAASRFLAERYGAGVQEVAALGAGDWSRAFSFRLGDRALVARFGRHRSDFEKDRAARAFDRPGLPVPAVIEIGEAFGAYYAISERRFGVFFEALDERQWQSILPALLRALDALRKVTAPGPGVEAAAVPAQQALVHHLARDGVLEAPATPARQDQIGLLELGETGIEVGDLRERAQDRQVEIAA